MLDDIGYVIMSKTAAGALARNTVQLFQYKIPNFLSHELWSQKPRAKNPNFIRQCEYELRVNKIKEIKQRLVEWWQNSNSIFE